MKWAELQASGKLLFARFAMRMCDEVYTGDIIVAQNNGHETSNAVKILHKMSTLVLRPLSLESLLNKVQIT